MPLTPSAHVDTFCRDHLPPQPSSGRSSSSTCPSCSTRSGSTARSSCSTRRRRAARRRPALPARARRRALDLRRPAGAVRTRSPQVLVEDLGLVPGQPGAAARTQQPVAGRLLVRRAQGRRRRRHDHAAAARRRARHDRTRSPGVDLALCDHRFPDDLGARRASRAARRRPTAATAATTSTPAGAAKARRRSRRSTPRPTTSPCWPSPRARPAAPRPPCTSTATCSPIADTFSAHVAPADGRRRVHRHARRSPSPSASAGWSSSRCAPAPSTLLIEKATPGRARRPDRRARRHGAASPRRPRTGRCSPAGNADRLARLRRAVSAGEHLPAADLAGLPRRDRGRGSSTASASTEMLHIFISAADDDIRPGATGKPVPGYRRHASSTHDGNPVPRRRARAARGQGPDRLPLPRRRAAAGLRRRTAGTSPATPSSATPTATSGTRRAATT